MQGIQGEQGKPADNPIITENVDNTEDVYKLDLTVGETVFTTKNIIGKQGLEGVSPSVTTNPDNTAEDYRLNITTKGGTFTTPNLRGPQGEIGPQGESAASAINPRGDYDVNADPHYTVSDYITSAEGNTYVCKKDTPDNVAPTDGTVNDEFWQILALRGARGEAGKDGEKGADGVTFTPSIDENGVLSFTNNGGLENPNPIDIKGDNGVTFTPSIDTDGYLSFTNNGNLENPEPIKVLGQDGADGKDGIDGTTYIPSIGTVTTVENNADASAGVTVDEETKEAVFHFEIPKGEKGFSPIVETVESENGHTVNITDVDGVKSFDVFNGKDGVLIDDETTSTDTVWSSKKTSDKVDGLISDTSSTTSTYSSAKIDEKINDTAKLVYFSRAANRGYLKITNADDGRPISISDVCGGKIEIYGSGRVVASDNYYFAKVLRLSYGNWTTFDATKDTVIHKKIFKTYLDETNKTFYVEVSTHARFCVEGAKTVEMLELDDVDIAQFTEIPESAFASISDSSTSETSTWSSSKIANEINPTIDRTDLFPSNELDLNLLYNRCGTGVYDIVGQGTAGHGMIRADLWAINNGTICYIVSIMYSDGSSSTVGGNINAQPTVPINSKWMSVINKLTKIGYL